MAESGRYMPSISTGNKPEWKALMLARQNPPVRQARREYLCRDCEEKKQFMRLNSHRH
jgi:hypothetical protein